MLDPVRNLVLGHALANLQNVELEQCHQTCPQLRLDDLQSFIYNASLPPIVFAPQTVPWCVTLVAAYG